MAEFWEKTKAYECFSTEEKISEARTGHIYTRCHGGARSIDSETGVVVGRADCEEDPIFCSRLDSDNDLLYTVHKSKLVRAWSCPDLQPWVDFSPMRTDHKGPIVLVSVKGSRLISASADSVIKVWHLGFRHCSGVLRNCQGLPLCLEYVEFPDLANIAVCGTNSGAVHAWNADTNELIATGTKHFSQVSSLKPLPAAKSFVSAGRDKTLIFWTWNLQPTKIIPAFEEIETIQLVSKDLASKVARKTFENDGCFILTGGEKGKLRLWDVDQRAEVLPSGEKKEFALTSKGVLLKDQKVSELLVDEQGCVTIIQDDLLSRCAFEGKKNKVKQFAICANQHEALELCIVGEKYLVVATMSSVIKVYNLAEDFKLIIGSGGHTDSVLAVAPMDDDKFVSCGKDHAVCLWSLADGAVTLIGKGSGHSSFVGALATSHKYIFSASKDGILKVWKKSEDESTDLQTVRTLLAHDQEINSVSVSANGEFVATASQDKTCKIWRIKDMGLLATLSSHKRGIWRVKCTEEAVWTTSADCTIKKWSPKSFQCLSTFEGHLASVLGITMIDVKRVASVASDGLLKIWDTKTGTAVGTFDAHEDKVWSVVYSEEAKVLITAGRDGNINFWTDKTDEHRELERQKANEIVKTEQTLSNYMLAGRLDKALRLSLRLDRPRQAKKILTKMKSEEMLENAVNKLDLDLKNILLRYVTQWNTIGGASCELAQVVLSVLLKEYLSIDKADRPYKVDPQQVAGLVAYTDKHYKRLDKLQSRVAVVDLLLSNM